jgi:hypothetical protein
MTVIIKALKELSMTSRYQRSSTVLILLAISVSFCYSSAEEFTEHNSVAWVLTSGACALGRDGEVGSLWVDNVRGADNNPGSEEKPFFSIDRGLKQLKPGMTLHVLPTAKPYASDIRIEVSGTAAEPIVVDGHGSLVSGRRRLPTDAWTSEGGGVYSRPLRNNAWGMYNHWEGGFPLVWFDGAPGRNVTTRDALQPLCFFLYKNRKEQKTDPLHNTLYIRLPAGKTLDEMNVESIAGGGGIFVGGSHVKVRNFTCEYGGRDAFATHRNEGVVFENIEGRYFMDQGMSHHGADVSVLNAHFHHNAGCGVVDVYPEAKARYENCLIEYDTWRGGVEFHSGQFEMVNCVISANPKKALTVTKGAQAILRNCLLIAPATGEAEGISVSDGSSLALEDCTLCGFATGLRAVVTAETRLTIRRCAILSCDTNLRYVLHQDVGDPEVDPATAIRAEGNVYEPAPFEILSRVRKTKDAAWKATEHRCSAEDHAGFAAQIGSDRDATVRAVVDIESKGLPSALARLTGFNAGASLQLPLKVGPEPDEAAASDLDTDR